MYNGIGLQTARGSGTNGYVQRNMSFVHKGKEKVNYKTEEDIKKLDALSNRKPNQGILAHERKRTIELKCLEMQELMEEEGYPPDEISSKVAMFREMLLDKNGVGDNDIPKDEFGRPLVKESHQLAEANQEKNSKMRNALGISPFFVEGSSLDPERRNKEAAAAAAEEAKKKYTLIPDSSDSSPERSQEKEKKRKKKKSPSNSEKEQQPSKKKKSVKKHKRDRSESPNITQKKKKSKKTGKEKTKHKSKSDSSRKKHARSSSSSSSSSSSGSDNDSSSRSSSRDSNSSVSSQDKPRSSLKHDKGHKVPRKRSTSSERIRYAKDARSRKDIYEAKKAKYKKKTRSSTSSSSVESPPRQYYRLEPVLVKSKSKHKAPCQIFEIPKKSALELMKYERKKRKYQNSSSSSDEGDRKLTGKRRKHSESPIRSKASKHVSGRDQDGSSKQRESHKIKRSERIPSSVAEKHSKRSDRSSSQHKSESHKRPNYEDYSDNQKKKDRSMRNEERYHEKEKSGKRNRRDADSPEHKNGYSRQIVKSRTPGSDDTDRRSRSHSVEKRKNYDPRTRSPDNLVGNQKEKFIPHSPKGPPPDMLPRAPRTPSVSPPRKPAKQHRRSRKSSSDSSPPKRSKRHDSDSRSRSPDMSHRSTKSKKSKETRQSRRSSRENSESVSRSPSVKRSSHVKPKHRSNDGEKYPERSWKSKAEVKDVRRSSSGSLDHNNRSKQKRDKGFVDSSAFTKKAESPKGKGSMTVTVETCQITSTKSPVNSTRKRGSESHSPERLTSLDDIKALKQNDLKPRSKDIASRNSPVHSKDKIRSPVAERSKNSAKPGSHASLDHEAKSKHSTSEASVGEKHDDFVAKKNNWNVVTPGENGKDSLSQDSLKVQKIKQNENEAETRKESFRGSRSRRKKTPDLNPSRSGSENPELESGSKNKVDESRSRSRSNSLARSASHSASERSSRSRSYSQRDSKSRSRSKSYTKSRSRSRSQSRSKSRSHSKSYSRSRSQSAYSRSRSRSYSSRSRSRSNERSRSIPRRRGSPSFLDKRRITSARKRPIPYRRPSPSSPSSASSWSYRSSLSRSSSPIHPTSRGSTRSHSRSWSPVARQKYEVPTLSAALR